MPLQDTTTLNAYATIAQQAYLEPDEDTGIDTGSLPVSGENGSSYTELFNQIDGPFGFQTRAFFNNSDNELVIVFAGTEGAQSVETASVTEFVPDVITDLSLAVVGVSPQDAAVQAFIAQATAAAQLEVGLFGSFDVTYVGHSLGGFLAQTASASGPEGEVVLFNSPGAGGFLGLPESHPFPEDNFTNALPLRGNAIPIHAA